MIIVDKMLVGGVKFVLQKLAAAVDAEMNDESRLRETLLEAQMRLELGEITDDEFAAVERAVLERIRALRGESEPMVVGGDVKISGVEAKVHGDD
jgi:hypothetical protein